MERLALAHHRVLLVEDDYYIASDLARALQARKVEVVGPFGESSAALGAISSRPVDAAILDVKLNGGDALSIADVLSERAIPFVFATGVDAETIPEYFHDVPRLEKPFHIERVFDWLSDISTPRQGSPVEPSATFENAVLNRFPFQEIAQLRPHMSRVHLKRRAVVSPANRLLDRVYFVESGMISLIAMSGDHAVEVAVIGRENMFGPPLLAGLDRFPLQGLVQVDGAAVVLPTSVLQEAARRSASIAAGLALGQHLLSMQAAYTALASSAFSIEQRLARWLLMCQDRVGDNLTIVHEFLSLMLHVRRPSVTTALQSLEAMGAITSTRGRLCIKDREKLLVAAGSAYDVPEREQQRVSGVEPYTHVLN